MIKKFNTTANVILTFDSQPQEFYDAEIEVEYDEIGVEFEVSVVSAILSLSERDLSDLVKISLSYYADVADEPLNFLIRNSAKYYFQPNQRGDYEQAIVDALGIALKTKELMV